MQPTVDTADASPTPPESPIFAATLTPHRSLGPVGVRLVIGFVAAVSLISAVPFLMFGAWPVTGFFGLDVALLVWLFRRNIAEARGCEHVAVSRALLLVRKVCWRGRVEERRFNPCWVRLKTETDEDYGMRRLAIVQRREEVEIGGFLPPCERADFAQAFSGALAEARK